MMSSGHHISRDIDEATFSKKFNVYTQIPSCICDRCSSNIDASKSRYSCQGCTDCDICSECFVLAPTCPHDRSHGIISASLAEYRRRQYLRIFDPDFLYRCTAFLKDPGDIRLLHIRAADNFDDPIKAYMRAENLEQLPTYYALSYCWGSDSATNLLDISSYPFAITKHLEMALKRFRHIQPGSSIWVDALCINQGNVAEKTAQVNLMRRIYAGARVVYTYLGEYSADSMCKPPFSTGDEEQILEDFLSEKSMKAVLSEETSTESQEKQRNLFQEIVDHPWFSRTWVIQESSVNLAVEVMLGSLNFKLFSFLDAINVGRWTPYAGLLEVQITKPAMLTLHLIDRLSWNWFSREKSTTVFNYERLWIKSSKNLNMTATPSAPRRPRTMQCWRACGPLCPRFKQSH